MGSFDRSKKRVQPWKKAVFHVLLCFIMGFISGFTPTSRSSILSDPIASNHSMKSHEFSPPSIEMLKPVAANEVTSNRNLMAKFKVVFHKPVVDAVQNNSEDQQSKSPVKEEEAKSPVKAKEVDRESLIPKKVLILITPTTSNDPLQGALLRKMGTTLKLVSSPLLWIVVEAHSDSSELSEILRDTGVMYRHLVFKEKFTDYEAEMEHQRNVALNLIEYHRLDGIVHFAGLSNFYDLDFFEEIRETEIFGVWPIASVSGNRKKLVIEGPICDSMQVIGWQLWGMSNQEESPMKQEESLMKPIHISSFAFNSSILWDPERWNRPLSAQDITQNSVQFIQQVIVEDSSKLKGIPKGTCSRIMLWNVHIPRRIPTVHPFQISSSIPQDRW